MLFGVEDAVKPYEDALVLQQFPKEHDQPSPYLVMVCCDVVSPLVSDYQRQMDHFPSTTPTSNQTEPNLR